MKKRYILYIFLGMVVLAVIGSLIDQEDEKPTPSTPDKYSETGHTVKQVQKPARPTYSAPILRISAKKLYDAYEENEIAADLKYKDEVYIISGTITSIGKDIMNTPYIVLEAGNVIGGVQCLFGRSDDVILARLSKNQSVYVKGTIKGKTLTNILVRKCALQ